MSRYRVLVEDDHRIFSERSRVLFEPELDVVGLVACGQAMVDATITLRPDVSVSDIRMPSLGGIETASRKISRGTH